MGKRKLFFIIVLGLIIYSCYVLNTKVGRGGRPLNQAGVGREITYELMFREIAGEYDLDWRLLALHAYRESRFDHRAVGRDNDMGLMQILPSTWNEFAPRVGVSDPYDPYSNVLVGAAYLAYLRDYFEGQGYPDHYWALVAYNWGPYNLDVFLNGGGEWHQVPAPVHYYALDILQTSPNPSITWAEVEAQLTAKTSIRR